MILEEESGLSSAEVARLRERCNAAQQWLVHMRDSLIAMCLDRGIDQDVLKTQMVAMIRDFGEAMDKHQLDPLAGHAVVCSLAIATLEKWKP